MVQLRGLRCEEHPRTEGTQSSLEALLDILDDGYKIKLSSVLRSRHYGGYLPSIYLDSIDTFSVSDQAAPAASAQ